MPLVRLLRHHHLLRWTLTLILALVAALAIHFARIYPWHTLYLSKSTLSVFDYLPQAPVSPNATCFVPTQIALESSSFANAVPVGSLDKIGLADDRCVQYHSRFEPYLSADWGNTYIAQTQEQLGLQSSDPIRRDLIWLANLLAEHDPATYPHIDWSNATLSTSCLPPNIGPASSSTTATRSNAQKPRLALVLRCYQDFVWSQDAILHLRALVWELRTGTLSFDADVHLLVQVKDAASFASMFTSSGRKRILRGSVPIEFWSLVTLWSEQEMILRYPLYGDFRPGIQAAGSYRGCLLPLQRFAVDHPEYDSLVNWEMDTRFTHTYDRLLESIYTYAYQASAQTYTSWPVNGVGDSSKEARSVDTICSNKSADVIVLSPARDPQDSGWYWEYDVQGYPSMQFTARSASVGTNLWLSRRAIVAMENITANEHQSLFCEAMAPSLAFRSTRLSDPAQDSQCESQFKLVHYPHPVAFRYQASPVKIDRLLNPSRAALSKHHEEALKDTSYYYTSTIAGQLYSRWQTQPDACIMPMVLHPIKSSAEAYLSSSHSSRLFSGGSSAASLCASSTRSQCAEFVKATILRYTGRDPDSGQQESLYRWDLEHPRYISRKPLIMNSSTRSLIFTIFVLALASVVCSLAADCLTGAAKRSRTEYISLATE